MQLTLSQIVVPPGHQVLLKDIDWQTLENILEESNQIGSHSRISYSQGWLELMSPLAVHEDDKTIIGNLIEVLLEELDIEFRALGSTTLKSPKAKKAVAPDECFYIQHEAQIRGKSRIDLNIDPPPDLAIEIDITHRSHFDNYEKLGVPELWRYNGEDLKIFVLVDGCYQLSDKSRQFPDFDMQQMIPHYLEKSKVEGRNKAIKAFRQKIIC
ncbi:Uma2 family endonuclease [Candidatus Venteria ishoeyi]|uniref:Uma2 family endonuclease n=1 Tax=Candidatus Venteria ishoeyi TaxID=1899563 RepID=UPI0025A513CE|nr:Uma2 family endonuclease [Candidatus Venteria ishoeyi]MDM8546624.1 Uma2 family endonuclease [Candidatus Venteria ishoeyi]